MRVGGDAVLAGLACLIGVQWVRSSISEVRQIPGVHLSRPTFSPMRLLPPSLPINQLYFFPKKGWLRVRWCSGTSSRKRLGGAQTRMGGCNDSRVLYSGILI